MWIVLLSSVSCGSDVVFVIGVVIVGCVICYVSVIVVGCVLCFVDIVLSVVRMCRLCVFR